MISERKRIAELYRSQGKGESARISGEMSRELKQIESEAYRSVQAIKGEADAKATTIYAQSYSLDVGLYELLKSLESYRETIDESTWIILSTDSPFFSKLSTVGP